MWSPSSAAYLNELYEGLTILLMFILYSVSSLDLLGIDQSRSISFHLF